MEFTNNALIVSLSDIINALHDDTLDAMVSNMETVMSNGYEVSIHRKSLEDITFTDVDKLKAYINTLTKPHMQHKGVRRKDS
jgi:isopropylmalate/homocitrate/citramalate synthase